MAQGDARAAAVFKDGAPMNKSQTVAGLIALAAAVVASQMLSGIFRLAGVPCILVAALAIANAGVLALGVAIAAIVENW